MQFKPLVGNVWSVRIGDHYRAVAPKRGDLVFAKTGELLGIMVNNDYCAVLKNFAPAKTIRTGSDIRNQATGALFDELIARVRAMPLKLQ